MSQATMDDQRDSVDVSELQRGFTDRHPLLTAVIVAELVVLVPAAVLLWLGDPMATNPNTKSIIGALLVVTGVVVAAVSVAVALGTLVIRIYTSVR